MLNANRGASEQVEGTVFDIKRYAVHDGPGIRTTVFLKGCPLRCLWCHNPESQDPRPEIMYHDNLCVECGECVKVCPAKAQTLDREHKIRRDLCTKCGRCVEACYAGALKLMGRNMTVEEVLRELEKDEHFYRRSGGGVTLSGGEPASQPSFTTVLLKECKGKGYHTVLQTCGHVGWPNLEQILRYTDLVQYDVKHMDPGRHLRIQGPRTSSSWRI